MRGRGDSLAEAAVGAGIWEHLEARRPLHVPRAAPGLAAALNHDAVASALAAGGDLGATSAQKRGESYMRNSIFLAYLDQATLSLAGAERFLPVLLEACQTLAAQAFDYVSARLVLEPPACSAPTMVPDADVLAVQLWGSQQLTIQRPLAGLPVTAPRPQPMLCKVMRPGDALLVPAGLECRASPLQAPALSSDQARGEQDGPMLYALLTLRTSEQSMDISLGKYLTDLLREGGLSEDADSFMRAAVTRSTLHAGDGLAERLQRFAGELASRVNAEGLQQHYARRMEEMREEQRTGAAKHSAHVSCDDTNPSSSDSGPVLASSTRLCVASGVACRCAEGDTVAYFTRGTETLNLPIAESASRLIHDISDGRSHTIGSLRCADPFERLCVCQVLVGKGCLEVC